MQRSERGRRPPRMAEWLMRALVRAPDRDWVLGDLHEEFERRAQLHGRMSAGLWYWRQTAASIGPVLRRNAVLREGRDSAERRSRAGIGSGWLGELKHAVRALRKRPVYGAVAIVTLAVAMGANAATFGVVDAVLLKSLPYPQADRLVAVSEVHATRFREPGYAAVPDYVDWREQSKTFADFGLFRGRSMAVTGAGDALYVYGAYVSPSFFTTFGVQPLLGRALRAGEDGRGAAPVAMLSYGFWQRRYDGAPDVIGRTLVLDGRETEIVGVMPRQFNAPGEWIGARMDVWVPFVIDPAAQGRDDRSYSVVGRLQPGATLETARAEMAALGARLQSAYPESNRDWTIRLDGWQELIVGYTRAALFPLWGAMTLLLLVACANVANLVLNRALARREEMAVRVALGAGRGRMIRGALIESLVLACIAAAGGIVVARLLLAAIILLNPGDLPRLANARMDASVLAVTAVTALLVAVLLGALPALRAARSSVYDAIRAGRTGSARRVRDAMAIGQLALALALLAALSLVLRGFMRLRAESPGFDAHGVLAATVALSRDRVPDQARRAAFTSAVLQRIRAIPGVTLAAMINSMPFTGSSSQQTFAIAGVAPDPQHQPFAGVRGISPGYASTMRIPVRGREFTEADMAPEPGTILINEALARRYFPNVDPIGKRIITYGGDFEAEIVGVLGDVHHFGLDQAAVPEMYVPYSIEFLISKTFIVRTAGDAAALARPVRDAIHAVDPDQPLRASGPDGGETVLVADLVGASLSGARFHTAVLLLVAALALLLATVGLFSAVAITVTERSREIGLRMALGAERRLVFGWILSRSARMTAVAIAIPDSRSHSRLAVPPQRWCTAPRCVMRARLPVRSCCSSRLRSWRRSRRQCAPRASTPRVCCARSRAAQAAAPEETALRSGDTAGCRSTPAATALAMRSASRATP